MSGIDYRTAGVDLAESDLSKERIKRLAQSTFTKGVIREVGLFGGFFRLDTKELESPVLVSSIDGVGTKIKIAATMERYDTIGEDLVNHCVNDILTSGATPLVFLDYLAFGKLRAQVAEEIVSGIARACREAQCALIGGETAEMPGVYAEGEFDVAGCIVGLVDEPRIIDGRRIQPGDMLFGLPSNGLHTNGYSLARKVLLDMAGLKIDQFLDDLGSTLGDELLRVHRSYYATIQALLDGDSLKGIAHVTGGGIEANTSRLLPKDKRLRLEIDWSTWQVPEIFRLIQRLGEISDQEMRRVFNLGIGMVLVVSQQEAEAVDQKLRSLGEVPVQMGRVVSA
jgi:phosphoribosylformylglycinamidine cyclo-ligase